MAVPGVNPIPTEATGIFPSDLLIKKAIEAGIKELRANAWLQDYVFAGLNFDDLTSPFYGQMDINTFKTWFKQTDIKTYINVRLGDVTGPSVSISLVSSVEEENTLADLHVGPVQEDVPVNTAPLTADSITSAVATPATAIPNTANSWPALTSPFNPQYTVTTGQLLIPASVQIDLFPGMNIIDGTGKIWPIQDVLDNNTAVLQTGIVTDFRGSVVKAATPAVTQTLESALFRETYVVGCHVNSDEAHLIYLYGVVMFVLLRGRQFFLEARGFERSALSATDFAKNPATDNENVYSRYVSINGYCRHAWPKFRYEKVSGVSTQLVVFPAGKLPPDAQPVSKQNWIGDMDTLGGIAG